MAINITQFKCYLTSYNVFRVKYISNWLIYASQRFILQFILGMDSPKKKNPQLPSRTNGEDPEKGTTAAKKYKEKTGSEQHTGNKDRFVRTDKKAGNNFQAKYQDKHQRNQNYSKRQQGGEKQKGRVSSLPMHILDCSTIVDQQELGIKVETRLIKKYFLEKYFEAAKEELVIRRATYFPCIFFEYCNEERRVVSVDYKDVVRSNKKKFQERPQLVSVLFNLLYQRVQPKYFKLAVFGLKCAKDRNILMTHQSVFKQDNVQLQLMFYYAVSKRKQINFTIIDKYLNFVYFRTDDILRHRQYFEEQFDLFLRFQQIVTKTRTMNVGDRWDILQNEEIQFNQKDIKYVGECTSELQKKLEKKLTEFHRVINQEYYEELREKEALLKQMGEEQDDDNWLRIQKLDKAIEVLTRKIRQGQKVAKEISYQLQKRNYKNEVTQWFYIKSIKKLILAQKQLSSKLPILEKKAEILRMLKSSCNKPLIIEGQTGSGKSTQLPQILLEYCSILDDPFSKPILVTQPRRLATRTLAERVALELGEQRPNNFVDFKISIDKEVNPYAKIIFKLDRLVLDQITEDPLLEKYSCLIIDQAHQRTISIDVIIGLIRNLLDKRSDFKVIITSASMDVELFEREFDTKALKVSGRLYEVKVQYKDYQLDTCLAKMCKVIDEEILHDENSLKQRFKGHILVFCSGVDQINKLTEIYTKKLNQSRFLVFPLHGKIVPEEQRKAFQPCKQHKFIFASRIAETAITIDDVRVVVDPGEDIQMIYDQKYKFSSMKMRPISQSSAKQRAGRAGRTAPGFCFRLYSQKNFYQRPLGKVPEMENSSLDTVVLRLKSLGIQDVISFPYISKPDREGLLSSIENLKMISALSSKEQITQIGQLMILIPVEPMLSRSILEALLTEYIFSLQQQKHSHLHQDNTDDSNVVYSVVQILCMIVNSSSLFHIHEDNQNQGQLKKFQQFQVNQGDFFFLRSIYREFKENLELVGDKAELSFWIKEFYLSKKALKQVKQLQSQILKIISSMVRSNRFKFDSLEDELDEIKQKLRHCKSFNDVLMGCLITSFIPNLCIYSQDPMIGYTLISQERPIAIYGTSTLSLVGLTRQSPKWILAYDLYTSQRGKFYCKIAQGIDFQFLKNTTSSYAWKKFNLGAIEKINPFYEKIWDSALPTKVYTVIKSNYVKYACGGEDVQQKQLYKRCTWIFQDQDNFLKVFMLKGSGVSNFQLLKKNYHSYFEQIKNRYMIQEYRYPYYGNSQAHFDCLFRIKSVEKLIQKDILISNYSEDDYEAIKIYVQKYLSDAADIDIFPYSRNVKLRLKDERYLRIVEEQIQKFFSEHVFKQRPSMKVMPRNQRRSSQLKVRLIFYVPNQHEQFDNNTDKYYKWLKDFCDDEDHHLQLSHKSDLEWKEEIVTLLNRVNVNPEDCAINIWGNFQKNYKRSEFIELCAEISSFESGIYQKLYEFQGKKRYLGCDKLFIRKTYEQIIAFPSERIFNSLKDQFISILISQKQKCKELLIDEKCVRMRSRNYIKIIAKCPNRQILTHAAQRIAYLFEPKMVELKDEQIRFLIDIDRYQSISRLEQEYKYTIAFQLNKCTKSLAIYCPSVCFDEIVSKLKGLMKASQYVTNRISYKGKNLNEVLQVIERVKVAQEKDKKIKLEYEIVFSRKEISLTTIPSLFYELKQQIQNLSKTAVEQCTLCSDSVKSAFILLNCNHHFCRICLLRYTKNELASNQEQALRCPKGDCSHFISIYDMELIAGEHQFEKIADARVRTFVQKNKEYRLCPQCLLILDKQGQKTIQCDNCGYYKCQICGRGKKSNHKACLSQQQSIEE